MRNKQAEGAQGVSYSPASVWAEYSEGLRFKHSFSLFETVRRNEAFYIGEQWEGVNAPDLDKPVFNLLRRVVTYFISTIVSDDIAVSVNRFGQGADDGTCAMLEEQFLQVMEGCGAKTRLRELIRNAAVDGDGCLHYFFDPGPGAAEAETYFSPAGSRAGERGPLTWRGTPGYIEAEVLDNTAICFGNPQVADVQKQPYIIVAFRRRVEDVKKAARANGCDENAVTADSDSSGSVATPEDGKVTVLRRYWKDEAGAVWYMESCAGGLVKRPTDSGLARYPLVWMPWESVKNRYHGQAAITGMIPNQIFVNKLFAMAMQHVKMMAFPKVVYDRTKLPGGWSNQVGGAIGVAGNPADAVAGGVIAPEMSGQVMEMIEKVIAYTRDTMGATDAALGNIRPENTSAIIAVQKASSMPLELQKMEFYRVVEDSVRIWLDMMGAYYGVRLVGMVKGEDGEQTPEHFNFQTLRGIDLRLNVDIGAATYWSELVQVQTLDNLFERGIIPDAETYLELVPAAYLRDKALLLEAVRRAKAEAPQAGGEASPEAETSSAAEEEATPGGEEELARAIGKKGGLPGKTQGAFGLADALAKIAQSEGGEADPAPKTPLLDMLMGGMQS